MRAVKLGRLAALILVAAGATGPALSRPDAPPTPALASGHIVTRRGEVAELGGSSPEMAFAAGRRVLVTAQVADDIFASGGEVRVDGATADHLFLSGGEIDAAPAAVHDLIAAGGRIVLRSGAVSDDVVAAGGEITLDRAARVAGAAMLAGGRLHVEAPIGGDLMASGGRVEVNGPVADDVRIRAEEIVIGPQARIAGDLYARGARIEISPSAVVQGRTVRDVVKRDGHPALAAGLLAVLLALGVLAMMGLVAAAAPQLVQGMEARLRARLAATVGVGVLLALAGPLLILALAATVLGAPLALLFALAYLLAIPLAFAGVSYWIGQFVRGRVAPARAAEGPRWWARLGWTALAGLLLTAACMIPFVGGIVWLLALAAGMGAIAAGAIPPRPETSQR